MNEKKHSMDFAFIMALLAIFIACSIIVSVFCATVYEGMSKDTEINYNYRTGIMYLTEKVHQNDTAGSVRVAEVEGEPALVLTEKITGQGFETWIFVYDGQMCESVLPHDTKINLESAQKIMPMKAMKLELNPAKVGGHRLMKATVVNTNDHSESVELYLNSAEA